MESEMPSLGFLESPAVHQPAVKIKPAACFFIFERIVGAELSCRRQTGNETCLLTVQYCVRTAMPASLSALNQSKQIDDHGDVENIVNDMLKPPCLDDLALINLTDRIVRYKARFVGALRPWLLVVHNVRDFIVVRAGAVLLDVITPRAERLGFIGRQNRGVMMD